MNSPRTTHASSRCSWPQGPSAPGFPSDHVDVWSVDLNQAPEANSGRSILSADEIARADRFHFEKDRIHFTRCRSALRDLLARYLGIPPAEIPFEYLKSGKPQLAAGQNPRSLQFNVSHSGGMALIAVGSGRRIGVDIEMIRTNVDAGTLAERFFSAPERAGLQALPERLRVTAFFACWTRKESFLKATGDGLSFPLADFSVSTHPEMPPVIEEIRGNAEAGKQWSFADLEVAEGYRGSVTIEGSVSGLKTYRF